MTFALIYTLWFCPAAFGIGYCGTAIVRDYLEQFED